MEQSSSNTQNTFYQLNDGNKMPKVGLGTYGMDKVDEYYTAIVDIGYRHIDTAHMYKNEEVIGEALQKVFTNTSIKREDMFIVTKLWGDQKRDVEGALKQSLEKLKLDYVDLYLVHWPIAYEENEDGKAIPVKIPNHKTWADMEALVKAGLTKSIGVSNFNVQSLMDMMAYCEIKPVCNQIELHPYLVQEDLVQYMKDNEIIPVAFCPLIRAGLEDRSAPKNVFELDLFKDLAAKYEKSAGQIILNWGLQRGHTIIPKSSKKERLIENYESQNFALESEDVDKITALNCNWRCCPSHKYFFTFNYNVFC